MYEGHTKNYAGLIDSGRGAIIVSSWASSDTVVTLEVNDSGVGIVSKAQPKIFDAFERKDESIIKRCGSLGLGFAISKVTVDGHGGIIRAQRDDDGHGATFTVELNTSE